MSYIVIYLRMQKGDDKIIFEGPFVGPINKREDAANVAAKTIVTENKGTAIPKVFELTGSVADVMPVAEKYFDRIREKAKESYKRIGKKRKRKKK